jgi:hypothetical protein
MHTLQNQLSIQMRFRVDKAKREAVNKLPVIGEGRAVK